jgi:hypothetical protein
VPATLRSAAAKGIAAGAVGTVALNTATYLDMLIRGRSPSDQPAKLVGSVADDLGVTPLGSRNGSEEAANRRSALGSLSGHLVGIGVGAILGVLRPTRERAPFAAEAVAAGLAAMAAADVPLAVARVSNPREWTVSQWASDLVPHLAYGAATAFVLDRLAG